MKLVEKHIITKSHYLYKELDYICFQSKNLYNSCLYFIRQRLFSEGLSTNIVDLYNYVKTIKEYQFLPRKISNQTLKNALQNWSSYYASIKSYKKNPNKFLGCPQIPKYLDKKKGRHVTTYELQALSKTSLKQGVIKLSGTNIEITTIKTNITQVRIIPDSGYYTIEIIYEQKENNHDLSKNNIMGIDLGVNNLAALTSNKSGFQPVLINGRPLKSINQFYNKKKKELEKALSKQYVYRHTSNRINSLTLKRNNKVNNIMHKASRIIINLCLENDIGIIVIGKNDFWKQDYNKGRANNQNFCNIPHARFIEMITYKAELEGIEVKVIEESYTSKCSFYHREEMVHHEEYIGKRVHRGLFKTKDNVINADVQGSYNIIRKAFPNAFSEALFEGYGTEGLAVTPVVTTIKDKSRVVRQ